MAPSRGLSRPLLLLLRPQLRHSSTSTSTFTTHLTNPKTQIYISRSTSPYLNLSLEHHLLTTTPPTSTILFLYTNAPSIILGRNQNPWTEVSLATLPSTWSLVRRRSGGGTVFHDLGNVNYSVICPSSVFDRDKHAQMVVKALRGLGVEGARVNCRHDIVVKDEMGGEEEKKVSGSAYKLTRLRSLHHGTCLLNSQNLKLASKLLKSPGRGWITARGVESVRSPIANVKVANEKFEDAVVKEFQTLYESKEEPVIIGEEEGNIPEVAKGMQELMSEEWIYNQTPQFTFSTSIEGKENLPGGEMMPRDWTCDFTIRHGIITSADIKAGNPQETLYPHGAPYLNTPLRDIKDWVTALPPIGKSMSTKQNPGKALNTIFGVPQPIEESDVD